MVDCVTLPHTVAGRLPWQLDVRLITIALLLSTLHEADYWISASSILPSGISTNWRMVNPLCSMQIGSPA